MKTLLSAAFLIFVCCGTAGAQTFEFGVTAGIKRIKDAELGSLLDQNRRDDDTRLRGGNGYGGRFTWNTRGYYGHEFGYMQFRGRVVARVPAPEGAAGTIVREGRVTIQQATYNFMMYMMPAGERWRPYITVGLQAHQYRRPAIPEWQEGSSRNYGINYGGGLKINLFPHAMFRLDARHYIGGAPYDLTREDERRFGGRVGQLEATAGISITF